MNPVKRRLSQGLLCMLLPLSQSAHADWAQSTDVLVVKPKPSDMQVQFQNPPTFSWARHTLYPNSYVLEIRSGTTVVKRYTTTRNWYLPPLALPNGSYTWRVSPTQVVDWSTDRAFIVSAPTSKLFEVKENADLRAAVLARGRPRGLQQGLPMASSWSAAMKAERANALLVMGKEVVLLTTSLPLPRDADWPLVLTAPITSAYAAQMTSVRTAINRNGRQLQSAALMYRLTGEQRYLDEVLRRGDAVAALSPSGPTSYVNQDQGTRVIALSLLKAIDGLGAAIDPVRRAAWLNIVKVRTTPIYNDLAGNNGRMDQLPFDSHGGINIGYLALISTLALGEFPEAATWFDFSVRSYASSLMVWSGPEGGFSNGSAYAEYAVDSALEIWQPLQQATGINLFAKPWSAGLLRFFMHFVPPGTKGHLFGDGKEMYPEFKFMKAFASRFATPEAAWYARSLSGSEDPLTLLPAPFPLPVSAVATAAPPPNAGLYPSIGWTAMHSNINDLARTSVYFKSSPYGSFTHSHGNQNGFVITKGGVPLLSETGWYDWYGSPLFNDWYRQTKSGNGLTFDGGKGQMVDGYRETLVRNGAVTAFSSNATLDYTEGNATAAYGGQLTSAIRQLWYLRGSNAVVVRDRAVSAQNRVFEWNFHSPGAMTAGTVAGSVAMSNLGQRVCVRPIDTPGLTFESRTGPPPKAGTTEYHGVFVAKTPALKADFLMLIDIGCLNPAVKVVLSGTTRVVTVGAQSISVVK